MARLHTWTPDTKLGYLNEELDQLFNLGLPDTLTVGDPDGSYVKLDPNPLSNDGLYHQRVGGRAGIFLRSYSNTANDAAVFRGDHFRGTPSSPSAVLSGDALFNISAQGYTGTTNALGGRILFAATENWSGSAQGGNIQFVVTPTGTTGAVTKATLTGSSFDFTDLNLLTTGTLTAGAVTGSSFSTSGNISTSAGNITATTGTITGGGAVTGATLNDAAGLVSEVNEISIPAPAMYSPDTAITRQDNDYAYWPTLNGTNSKFYFSARIPTSWKDNARTLNVRLYVLAPTASQQFRVRYRLKLSSLNTNMDVAGSFEDATVTSSSTAYGMSTAVSTLDQTLTGGIAYVSGLIQRLGSDAADTGADMQILGVSIFTV